MGDELVGFCWGCWMLVLVSYGFGCWVLFLAIRQLWVFGYEDMVSLTAFEVFEYEDLISLRAKGIY